MSDSKKHQLKVSQLLADLRSGDEQKIANAIKSFHVHGDAGIIAPVIEVWLGGLSHDNEAHMIELLEGLKDTSTVEPLMEAFIAEVNAPLQRKLVSVFWNSKLDFSQYLADFVLFAIEGDFLDVFEALTLIEQFESVISDSAIMEAQLLLTEYFSANVLPDEQKDELLKQLALIVKDFDQESGTDDLYLD